MASSQQVPIEQISPQLDVSETTTLVKNHHQKGSKKNLLVKSKAISMILFWTALISLVCGVMLNPEVYYLLMNIVDMPSFTNIVLSISLYTSFAIWLLFYPLAGYLADVCFGRYKVVKCSLYTLWCGFLIPLIIVVVMCVIVVPIYLVKHLSSDKSTSNILMIILESVGGVLGLCFILSWLIAFAGFLANVIQFGVDQLVDSPTNDSFLFIHWFLFTFYLGIFIGKVIWNLAITTGTFSLFFFGIVALIIIIFVPISLCVTKRRWFIVDTGTVNPYKDVAQIVSFAMKNKIPIQRSAFTFWEDDIPTGLDLGKQKYGGPFTTEQVENVKSFFGIVLIFFSLGLFFTVNIAASPFLIVLQNHMEALQLNLNSVKSVFYSLLFTGGTLYPLFVMIFVPIFLKFIDPLFKKYFPGSLKRIGVGLCLITLSLICSMIMDTIGHILPAGHNSSSIFAPIAFNSTISGKIDQSLHVSASLLIIQQFFVAVAYVFIYGGVYEFICAQSPHSMKGLLIGILFAIKGLFELIGVLVILLPFSVWETSPRVGLVYFLVNIVISVIGVVVFTVAAKRYQYRQRDELYNERKYIEEVFEKDIRHNQDFDDLDGHFESNFEAELQF